MSLVEISKATIPSDAAMKRKGYRPSRLRGINPTSDTFVREGTSLKRLSGPVVGGALGAAAALGAKAATKGRVSGYPAQVITSAGASVGTRRNVKSKDTVAYRKYGKYNGMKADSKWVLPGPLPVNIYSGKNKKKFRSELEK